MAETIKNAPRKISLVIVNDHALVLEGLRNLLQDNTNVSSISLLRSRAELESSLESKKFDAYLVDMKLPGTDGFRLVNTIRSRNPNARIIAYTSRVEGWAASRLAELDVDAVIFRTSAHKEILDAVNAVARGEHYKCPKFRRALVRYSPKVSAPTPRELDVLQGMARGYSSVELSRLLFISENTVETHRKNLMMKSGARNAVDLVVRAIERGYLTLPISETN